MLSSSFIFLWSCGSSPTTNALLDRNPTVVIFSSNNINPTNLHSGLEDDPVLCTFFIFLQSCSSSSAINQTRYSTKTQLPRVIFVNIDINASNQAVTVKPVCCLPPSLFTRSCSSSPIVKRTRCPTETRRSRYRSDSGHRRSCQRSIRHARRVYRLLDRHRCSYLLQTSLLQPRALSFIYFPLPPAFFLRSSLS